MKYRSLSAPRNPPGLIFAGPAGLIPLSGSKTSGSGTCSVPEQFETEQSVALLVEPEATARPSGSGRIILSFDWLSDPTVTDVKKFRNLNFSPPCRTIVAVIETFNGLIISLISCAIAETLLIFHSEHLLRLKNDDVTISTWSPDNFPHPHTTPPHPHTVFPCQVINARSTKNLKGRCGRPSHACHCSGMPDRRTARSRIVGSGLNSTQKSKEEEEKEEKEEGGVEEEDEEEEKEKEEEEEEEEGEKEEDEEGGGGGEGGRRRKRRRRRRRRRRRMTMTMTMTTTTTTTTTRRRRRRIGGGGVRSREWRGRRGEGKIGAGGGVEEDEER
ncbi:unnamed protein product, partial [Nesidiocoris tenuis]